MATLTVGPGEQYSSIQAAVAASKNGDVIEVKAGTYTNNFVTITDSITLEAVGGMVNMVETKPPTNLKGMLTIGTSTSAPNVTIDGFEISGVAIPAGDGGNGAGIRYQSGNLTLNDDWFQNSQDGLLATPFVAGTGNITINDSEFGFNGSGTGQTHNIYVGLIDSLTVKNSYIHDAKVGMEIQSRAENNTIEDNRIFDNNSTASYSISLPNGGDDIVSGNMIEKGLNSQNHTTMIAFMVAPGTGSPPNPSNAQGHWANSSLLVSDNTFVNDLASSTHAVWNYQPTPAPTTLTDNSFWKINPADAALGPADVSGGVALGTRPTLNMAHPWQESGGSGAGVGMVGGPNPNGTPPTLITATGGGDGGTNG
jgi:hypothetical protein